MKYIVDIKGEIEGDYEIIGKYEERPQGEWKSEGGFVFCNQCGMSHGVHKTNFCPNCGADLRGEENGK